MGWLGAREGAACTTRGTCYVTSGWSCGGTPISFNDLSCALDPYRHVPEETVVCPQDIVHPGPYFPNQPDDNPRPPVYTPGALSWKKVLQHVFQYRRCQSHHNILVLHRPLHMFNIIIKVPLHQQFGFLGALYQRCNDALNRRGVVGGELTPNDVPPRLPLCQLKTDSVWAILLYLLH